MEPVDEEIDTAALQLNTVNIREKYTFHIQKVLRACSKYRTRSLETDNINQIDCVEVTLPKLNLPVKKVELDILKKKSDTDMKNTLKEQIQIMKILHKKKNCPISQTIDKL